MKRNIFAMFFAFGLLTMHSIEARPWYGGMFAGITSYHIQNFDFDADFNYGAHFGIFLGYKFSSPFRIEQEFSYKEASISQSSIDAFNESRNNELEAQSGHIGKLAVIENLYVDLPIDCPISPYVGFGLGYGWSKETTYFSEKEDEKKAKVSGESAIRNWHNGIVFQSIAGFNYPLLPDQNLGVEYRYFLDAKNSKIHSFVLKISNRF